MKISTKIKCTLLSFLLLQCCVVWRANAEEKAIERQIREIMRSYGVQIHYVYRSDGFFPTRWRKAPISAKGKQLPIDEVERVVPLIREFLSSYPKSVLEKNLTNVYLLSELFFYGKSFGATNSKTSLYIKSEGKSRGFSDSYLLSRMFSEFSSILMRNYDFPEEEWQKINPTDFEYLGSGREILGKGKLYEQNEDRKRLFNPIFKFYFTGLSISP